MSIKFPFFTILLLYYTLTTNAQEIGNDLVQHVNTLVGTSANPQFSHGNAYPAIALPWGMNFWTPQTSHNHHNWVYSYHSDSIRGFRHTHIPSPWIGDYGAFSLMPVVGELRVTDDRRAAYFSHHSETAKPHYYRVTLPEDSVTVEITPTERSARLRFIFDAHRDAHIVLDAFGQGSKVSIDQKAQKITGYCRNNSGGAPENFANYFVIYVDEPFEAFGTWTPTTTNPYDTELNADYTGAYLSFGNDATQVNIRVASSFISIAQAERNLLLEIGTYSFEQIAEKGREIWNAHLGRVTVEGGTDEQFRTFYSNLYRVLLFPRMFFEYNEDSEPYYFSPYNGLIKKGYMFSDNGFWDTFRSTHPFYVLLYPEHSGKIMQWLVNAYEEGGWLPAWASPGYRNSMLGAHAVSVIADAYTKGIRGFDVEKAYEGALKDCFEEAPELYMGRYGFREYNTLGYVPFPDYKEAASATLEYAYDDFCIMRLAEMLGKTSDIPLFRKRAANYRNLFDRSINFIRSRDSAGDWMTPFDPFQWGGPFTEGNSWHYTWSVLHDAQGLIELMGGYTPFVAKLDSVIRLPGTYSFHDRGYNEVYEMHRANLGQYSHGNEPMQHVAYLYNHAGVPHKAQLLVRNLMDRLYDSSPYGYPGDEDNGQIPSWYLFSALGFYPVTPGTTQYVLGSPLFQKATLHLANGGKFAISAPKNSPENVFVGNATLNGEPYSKLYITHEDIQKGGEIQFNMQPTPVKSRQVSEADKPYSMSKR